MEKVKKGDRVFELLKQSIPILMGIFLFFNPFPHTTTIKEICFYLSAFIVLLLLVFKKVDFSFKTPLAIPFALFVLWSFTGLFFALNKPNSIHDFYAHLLEYLAFYYILEIWAPRGDNHLVVRKKWQCVPCKETGCQGTMKSRCMDELGIHEVYSAVQNQLTALREERL